MNVDLHQEAITWLLRLRDAPDDAAAQSAFDRWLAHSDQHRLAYLEALLADNAPGTAWTDAGVVVPMSRPQPRRWPAIAMFAAAAMLVLGVAFGPRWVADLRADERSAAGVARELVLADGSQVQLAPDSAFRVSFSQTQREIELLRGEMTIVVQPDARALSVRHRDFVIVDIGTTFTVSEAGESLRVGVAAGRVEVRGQGAHASTVALAAGEQAEWHDGAMRRWPYAAAAARSGLLVLDDVDVERALALWSRSSGERVVMLAPGNTERLSGERLSGAFPMTNARDRADSLDTICEQFGLEVAAHGLGVVALRAR